MLLVAIEEGLGSSHVVGQLVSVDQSLHLSHPAGQVTEVSGEALQSGGGYATDDTSPHCTVLSTCSHTVPFKLSKLKWGCCIFNPTSLQLFQL